MAYRLVSNNPPHWQGLSSDVKPQSGDGATCHSVDTGEQFVCHDGMWVEDLRLIYAIRAAAV